MLVRSRLHIPFSFHYIVVIKLFGGGRLSKTRINKNNAKDTLPPNKLLCINCESTRSVDMFYLNDNPLIKSERLPVCKNCIRDFIGNKESDGYEARVVLVLALMNKPFLYDLWEMRSEVWSRYIPQLSSFNQYKGMQFSDSIFRNKESNTYDSIANISKDEINEIQKTELTKEELEELVMFWGKGFSPEDYEFLQMEYEKLLNSYECDTYTMEMLFQEVAQTRLTIKKKRERGESVDKELKTLQDILGSANIKPVQETGANAAEQSTFGTLIKKWENERPIPEPDPAWRDVDGIRKYVSVWFFGHLSKMMGIKNDYTQKYEEELSKYTVENEEDDSFDNEVRDD